MGDIVLNKNEFKFNLNKDEKRISLWRRLFKSKKNLRIQKNEDDIKAIKDAIHNFYDYAVNAENPGEKVKGIEKLKDIHN